MTAAQSDLGASATTPTGLPFPPVTKLHIRNCAVPNWHAKYRSITPKTRLIPLNDSFLSYLRSDGIVLPPDGDAAQPEAERDTDWDDGDDADGSEDPTKGWEDIHAQIKRTIAELGGRVHPKLNWSAPKDATWIAATNSMECTSPNDIYLLLKSSDFISHDLQQAYYGCADGQQRSAEDAVGYHLVLRKSVASMVTSMEFRCFVRDRRLIAVCQRDLNHYGFMASLEPTLQDLIYDFYEEKLKDTFPDSNFVFDVYVPQPKDTGRVWLIDVNPWAPRTDPLLFSWLELLTMPLPADRPEEPSLEEAVVRLHLQMNGTGPATLEEHADSGYDTTSGTEDEADLDIDDEDIPSHYPDFRLVKRDDPEAYSFNSPLYSAHKIPKDIVDASMTVDGEGGMKDFMENWQQKVAAMESGRLQDDSSDEE